ncbi:hypothetical protein [Streptomyces spinosirectus]
MAESDNDGLLNSSREDVVASMNAWRDLPAAHLKVALDFWTERMKADDELRLLKERNRNRLDMMGMIAAIIISVSSVVSAITFAALENYAAAGITLSPTVFVILKLFITRNSDKADLKASAAVLNALTQQGGPPAIP